ncbi:YdcF family protein [Candidatus Planktophila limnetica]|uniref:YdcF family protein n=1 Tax=Candidatus Planktophila limnetica TaxID=573600 RepID=UPI001950E4AC|nr:YdcF family protein [Candidatus Planktophila limnetica]
MFTIIFLIVLAIPTYAIGKTYYAAHYPVVRGADAIVVMGAAQFDGRPGDVLEARLTEAKRIFDLGFAPIIITVGSRAPGDRTTEAASGRAWLISAGVPARKIVALATGRDTLVSTKAYVQEMKKREIKNVIIATDPYHCRRSMTMANDRGLVATCSPVQFGPNSLKNSTKRYLIRESGAYLAYITLGHFGINISDHLDTNKILDKVVS